MTSQLTLLRDVGTPNPTEGNFGLIRNQEFIDLSDGKVYSDDEGKNFLRQMHETEHVTTGNKTGSREVAVRDENGRRIHRAQLTDGAALYYAEKRVEATGRREKFDGRLVQMDLAPSDVHTNSAVPYYAAGYRIADGLAGNICLVEAAERPVSKYGRPVSVGARFCAHVYHPEGWVPDADNVLAQKLLLESDGGEGLFLSMANVG